MKITYRKLMHVACGQSLAFGRLEAYLMVKKLKYIKIKINNY